MPTPDTGRGPGWDPAQPLPAGGATVAGQIDVTNITDPATRSLIQSLSQQIDGYSTQVAQIAGDYQTQSQRLAAMDSTDPGYAQQVRLVDSLANSWTSAQNNYARAIDTRAQSIQKAIDNRWIQGAQQDLWKAQAEKDSADAAKARQDTDLAAKNAGPQRDLLIAQATASTANAALANAQASNLAAKTPAEIAQLQAAANEAAARTDLLKQQTKQAAAQTAVAPRAAEATTQTLEAGAGKAQRELQNMPTPEQASAITQNLIGQGTANIGATQATTAATQANTAKGVLGPVYGLDAQIAGIKQIADQMRSGQIPVGADPQQAIDRMNTALQQYISATLAGTNIADATKEAQRAVENIRQQDITQRQQDTTLQGQGMSGAASAFGSTIGPLIGAVKDLPAGSTALGPAAAAMFAPFLAAAQGGLVSPPPQVAAPQLPSFLQQFAGGQPAGETGAGGHQITINIGGAGGNAPAQQTSGGGGGGGASFNPNTYTPATNLGPNEQASPSESSLPPFMQGSMPTSTAHVNSLWANDPNLRPAGAMA